jgi:hypothetical protein
MAKEEHSFVSCGNERKQHRTHESYYPSAGNHTAHITALSYMETHVSAYVHASPYLIHPSLLCSSVLVDNS